MKDKSISEESKKKLEREYLNTLSADSSKGLSESKGNNDEISEWVVDLNQETEAEDDFLDVLISEEISALEPLPTDFMESLSEKWRIKEGGVNMLQKKPYLEGQKREVSDPATTTKKKYGIKSLYVLAAAILIVVVSYPFMSNMFGVRSRGKEKMNMAESYPQEGNVGGLDFVTDISESYETKRDSDTAWVGTAEKQYNKNPGQNKKIIENFNIGINTEHFDHSRQKLEEIAQQSGGFISTFEVYTSMHREKGTKTRTATITVKIPSENSAGYLETLHELGEIYNESKTMDDITKEYADIEIEIRNFEEAEKRYLVLYQKAESIEDMLRVENELSRLRNLIDTRKAMLINYDYKVMYSTFYINLNEVVEIKPVVSVEPGMWERAKDGFVEGLNAVISGAQNVFVYLVSIIPALIVTIVLLVIALLIVTMIRKKYKKRAARLGDEKVTDRTAKTDVDIRSSSDKKAESE